MAGGCRIGCGSGWRRCCRRRRRTRWAVIGRGCPIRDAMDAILLVLRTGMQWNALNATGVCSSSSAHRRFQEWEQAGVFHEIWRQGLLDYDEVVGIDWAWLAADGRDDQGAARGRPGRIRLIELKGGETFGSLRGGRGPDRRPRSWCTSRLRSSPPRLWSASRRRARSSGGGVRVIADHRVILARSLKTLSEEEHGGRAHDGRIGLVAQAARGDEPGSVAGDGQGLRGGADERRR